MIFAVMDSYALNAYAKINLGLDVTGVRPDGYHEVRMVMQTLQLHDELNLTMRSDREISVHTDLDSIADDESNLAYKAAALMMDHYNLQRGISIDITKMIPTGAGMAGGSADAAAVIRGMNDMYELGLDDETLCREAVQIGADVPYCIRQVTAICEGIGEKITPIAKMPPCGILIVKPAYEVSTKEVYQALGPVSELEHPDIDGIVEEIRQGNLLGLCGKLGNVLESVTMKAHPELKDICGDMRIYGALGTLMTGSGPAVYGLFDNAEVAKYASNMLSREEYTDCVILTEPIRSRSVL